MIVRLFGMRTQCLEEWGQVVHTIHFHIAHDFFTNWVPESLAEHLRQRSESGLLFLRISTIGIDGSQVLSEVVDKIYNRRYRVGYLGYD